jgi:two-component system, sensor histidine kinase
VTFRLSPPASGATQDAAVEIALDRRRERTRSTQLERLFQRTRSQLIFGAVLALFLWLGHGWVTGDPRVIGWALLVHAAQAAHGLLAHEFGKRGRAALVQSGKWLRVYLVVVALNSAAWGSATLWVLVHENSLGVSLVWVMVLLGMAGAGAIAVSAVRSAIYLWLLPLLLPLIGLMLYEAGPLQLTVGALATACLASVAYFADTQHVLLKSALQTKLDNDALVRALRQQVVLVEQANREKSRFLASASHDLRQPMHALGLFAAALDKQLAGSKLQPTVTHMLRSIDALEQSFTSMLDISKLDAGVIEPNMQSFPIRDLFRVLHMHCAGQAEERGLALRFKPGGKIVTSDPQLLERVLSNLVHNAIRYTQEGGIVVVVRQHQGQDSIEVWDTGVGIAEDELPKVFDEFYQVTNPGRDRSRGLGMGLAIVKRLVLLMGHSLEVRSRPGHGTMFRILLKPTEMADMDNMVLGADTVPSPIEEDRTLLLIDDEESIRAGMQALLQSWGYKVLTAGNIADACVEVRRHAEVIDLVISDLRLANKEDGIDAIEQVRRAYGAPLPALLVTGDTSPEQVKRAHDSGHQVLFKPVRTRDLHAALRGIP